MNGSVAVTVGHFDGAHLGHCRLVQTARDAVGPDGRVIVLSFDPSPLTVLRPEARPARLTHLKQRREWLIRAGADEVLPLIPTRAMLDEAAEDFLERITTQFDIGVLVEGPDFRFGRKRLGNVDTIRNCATRLGYRTIIIEPVEAELQNQEIVQVSSTLIRWLLKHGRVADATLLLGRRYELFGTVVPGDKRGRALNFPTTNLDCGDQLLPAQGVYAGLAHHPDGQSYTAAISVGTKPTFNGTDIVCEAYLLDYDGPVDDYHWSLRLEFETWIRDQINCESVEQLQQLLERDIRHSRDALQSHATTWRSPVEFHV